MFMAFLPLKNIEAVNQKEEKAVRGTHAANQIGESGTSPQAAQGKNGKDHLLILWFGGGGGSDAH
jgi:hypothetical protein